MANGRTSVPQVTAPHVEMKEEPLVSMDDILNKRRQESYGKAASQLGQGAKKYVTEKLFSSQKPRGGVR
jgi:hypothetical protein